MARAPNLAASPHAPPAQRFEISDAKKQAAAVVAWVPGHVGAAAPRESAVEVDPGGAREARTQRNGALSVSADDVRAGASVDPGRQAGGQPSSTAASRPADDISQIHGNIYLGKVQNAARHGSRARRHHNAEERRALSRDAQYDAEDIVEKGNNLRIEQMLKAKQLIIIPGDQEPDRGEGRTTHPGGVVARSRFVVLILNSKTYGISKRLPSTTPASVCATSSIGSSAEHGLIAAGPPPRTRSNTNCVPT
ncbi:MAG: hypothetical protein R2713_02460 [Ilumatobacteraceae bacterium]